MSKSSKSSKSNNANNDKALNECKSHYCDKVYLKMFDSIDKSFAKKMAPDEKKKYLSKMKKTRKKYQKEEKESCIKIYCNKGCKGTILEDGKDFPKSVESQFANTIKDKKLVKKSLEFAKNNRKDLFKNGKTTVLKDNFYEKTKRTRVAQLKKDKAISGCAIMML
jgi:hypothetical protein